MKICIIGAGYVGLVSATCFADKGHNVLCVDIDQKKVLKLNSGELTIYEPGLENIFKKNTKNKRLKFSCDLEKCVQECDIIFFALPTPPDEDGSADLKYVLDVSKKVGKIMTNYKVIINKSTVPVGTSKKVKDCIKKNYSGDFDVVSNPEFLREGVAIDDFMKPDRIVVGTKSSRAKSIMQELYSPFVKQGNPILFMDNESAELTKYAANSFLATKISFMNEIAHVSEKLGANIDDIRKGIGLDHRIGKSFLYSGIGYGGSCFPKDVKALVKASENIDYEFKILQAVETVNEIQKRILFDRINLFFNNKIKDKTISIWGLSFKPNTDDIREAPALTLINEFLKKGCTIKVYDPEATENVRNIYKEQIIYSKNQYEALEESDVLIIATEWSDFMNPNFHLMKKNMKRDLIFDGRNLYDPIKMKELNFEYFSIGRQ